MPEQPLSPPPEVQKIARLQSTLWRDLIFAVLVAAAFILAYRIYKTHHTGNHEALASCMAGKQVKMYGLYWCAHCAEQKEMFGESFQHISYIECGIKGSQSEEESCRQQGVKSFPTWQFADGSRIEGTQTLEFLAQKSGCPQP